MDGADARARQHGIGGLRDHRHVNGDDVAFLDAAFLHGVGEAADVFVKFLVGDLLVVAGIVAFPNNGGLIAAGFQVAVDAINGSVQRAVLEPFNGNVRRVEIDVLDPGVGLDPVDALAVLAPETFRILDGLLVHLFVFVLGDVRLGGESIRDRENFFVTHDLTSPRG